MLAESLPGIGNKQWDSCGGYRLPGTVHKLLDPAFGGLPSKLLQLK